MDEEKEEVKEEVKEDVKEDSSISSIFSDIKNLMLEQQKEIEALKSEINSFKEGEKTVEKEEEKTAFDEFKADIKKMLQGYNRGNPENVDNTNETFEKSQMDILNRRF